MSDLIEIEPGVFQPKELFDLYRRQEQQLGMAYVISRGVWHWQAKHVSQGTRLQSPAEVFATLEQDGRVLVTDHDGILGAPGQLDHGSLMWVTTDDYLAAVEKLGVKLKTP